MKRSGIFDSFKESTKYYKNTYPVDKEGLCELDHLQSDQQADGDQVVVQDDER